MPSGVPVLGPTAFSVAAGQTLTADLNAFTSDSSGNPVTFAVGQAPTDGTLHLFQGGIFTYQPIAGFSGVDTWTCVPSDDGTDGTAATITINVLGSSGGASQGNRIKKRRFFPISLEEKAITLPHRTSRSIGPKCGA